jgi:hypothetical protein
MAGFGEVPYIEQGMFNPPAIPAPPNPNAANARGGAAIDVYLELGAYAWGGTVTQPSGTIKERMAVLKTNPKLFINRESPTLSNCRSGI